MTRAELDRLEAEIYEALAEVHRDQEKLAANLEAAIDLVRRSPAAAEVLDLPELLGELSETYEALGRPDEALEATQQAITAGYRSSPDPRCRLAEIHLRSGDAEEAHRIYAEVKADTPDDVWLYNNAGLEYGYAGDHVRALEWLDPGLELAVRTHDPERLVGQLLQFRQASLDALGRGDDDLQRRGQDFVEAPPRRERRAPAAFTAPARGVPLPTAYPQPAPPQAPVASGPSAPAPVATAWFPADEWPHALGVWPEIGDGVGTTDHREYCRFIQRRLLEFRASSRAIGPTIEQWVAPVRIEAFRTWCRDRGEDPADAGARAQYAADRLRHRAPDVVSWPPGRNQRCWCASGRKYKQCCGQVRVE